ncbi:hypothetical protein [Nonomuraea sp. NPDC023979]|uniref:hypothetical protein n=1 Tax=Nonomuraea sp. NPDC023979 TaxID=3154796 RepID=UPI0033CFDB6F
MISPPFNADPVPFPERDGIPITRDTNATLLALGHHEASAITAAGGKLPLKDGYVAVDSTEWTIEHLWAVRQPKCDSPPQADGSYCTDDIVHQMLHDHDPDPDHLRIDVGELWGYYTADTPGAFPVTRATAWSILLPIPDELLANLPEEF